MGKFNYNEAPENDPIRIEQVWAEKPGGGVVHVTEDMPATTPVVDNGDGTYSEKGETKTVTIGSEAVNPEDTVFVATNEGFLEVGDYVTDVDGGTANKIIEITPSGDTYFEFLVGTSISLIGGSIPTGGKLYKAVPQPDTLEGGGFPNAKIAGGGTPVYITGNDLKAEDGEYQPVRLINGANVRKETAIVTAEQAQAMKGIHLV